MSFITLDDTVAARVDTVTMLPEFAYMALRRKAATSLRPRQHPWQGVLVPNDPAWNEKEHMKPASLADPVDHAGTARPKIVPSRFSGFPHAYHVAQIAKILDVIPDAIDKKIPA